MPDSRAGEPSHSFTSRQVPRPNGGFYKRGCQEKNTSPRPDGGSFSGHPALCGDGTIYARRTLDGAGLLRQNRGGWRSRGKLCWRATCQGITNWKLIEKLWAGAGEGLPRRQSPLISIDFPMPPKTRMTTLQATRGRRRVGCRWFHDCRWSFDSDALQAGTGWQGANHGSIGDSRTTAFLGYPRGHTVALETWRCRQSRLTRPRILTLEPERRRTERHSPR